MMIHFYIILGIACGLGFLIFLYLEGYFCKHEFTKTDEMVIPSEFDMVKSSGYKPMNYHNTTRIYVTDFRCKICGKSHRKKVSTKD